LPGNRTQNLNGNNFVLDGAGNIGIGNLPGAPQDKLDVDGQIRARSGFGASNGTAALPTLGFYNDPDTGIFRGTSVNYLRFSTSGDEAMTIDPTQNIGIGPAFAQVPGPAQPILARLHVDGDIRGNDIYSNGTQLIPDYVFQTYFLGSSSINEAFRFESLRAIEEFIKINHHLPGVTSAATAKSEGAWNLSKSNLQNLEKIEELFLHTIEQEKKIQALSSENEQMAKQLESLQNQMEEIKNLLNKKSKE